MSDTQKSPAQIAAENYLSEIGPDLFCYGEVYSESGYTHKQALEIFIKGWNAKPCLSQEEIEAIKQESWDNGFAHGLKEGGIDVNIR